MQYSSRYFSKPLSTVLCFPHCFSRGTLAQEGLSQNSVTLVQWAFYHIMFVIIFMKRVTAFTSAIISFKIFDVCHIIKLTTCMSSACLFTCCINIFIFLFEYWYITVHCTFLNFQIYMGITVQFIIIDSRLFMFYTITFKLKYFCQMQYTVVLLCW